MARMLLSSKAKLVTLDNSMAVKGILRGGVKESQA